MPIYEYQCEKCGVRFERLEAMSAKPTSHCPECDGPVHRVISPVGVIFRGSGFYVTDNRKSSSSTTRNTSKTSGEKETSSESKTESKASESKSTPSET